MHVSVERLRVGLLVGAVLLVGVIASFLGYARLRAHRFLKDLPGRMGAELRQETNGFTYSQTVKGRTVFTLHAAKALQRKDGKVTLEDVGIVLYGRTQDGMAQAGNGGGLADRIYGKEFEYDQTNGVVRALGEVHIDLQAPAPAGAAAKMDFAGGKDGAEHAVGSGGQDDRVIHVKTSGLVFLQKLGVASTDQPIEFQFRGMMGQAKGADYNSDTGVLVLQAEVSVAGIEHGRPAVLRAAHAEMDRTRNQMTLSRARYVAEAGGGGGKETASAEGVMVYGGAGSGAMLERVEARGSVVLTSGGDTMTGAEGEMLLNGENRPQSARLSGGVGFHAEDDVRAMQGTAIEGRGRFNKAGRMEQVQMTGAVAVHETETASTGQRTERHLTAGRLDLSMATGPGGKQWLREAVAEGSARLVLVPGGAEVRKNVAGNNGPGGLVARRGEETSEMRADRLRAQLQLVHGAGELTRVVGEGHTTVRRVSAKGEDTSLGNTLEVVFRAGPSSGLKEGTEGGGREEISTAVQAGDVAITHVGVEPGAAPEHAVAERALYEGGVDRVTLTGHVRLTDARSMLLADRVLMMQGTGDATATGSVRVSYLGAGAVGLNAGRAGAEPGEPAHVLAERAEIERATGRAVFYGAGAGGAGRPLARLWEGGSQVEAPVIELSQTEGTLRARGVGQGATSAVRTVLTSGAAGNGPGAAEGKAARQDVLRVVSRELRYSDVARRADFTGGVVLDDAQGTMRSQQAAVFFEPVQGAKEAKMGAGAGSRPGVKNGAGTGVSGAFPGGSVERIVASGGVDLQQTARRGQGEQLVYTAADGVFVMTGTAAMPPRIVDQEYGTVVGQSLRFNTADNRVVVSGDASGIAGHRVRTETRVRPPR